MTHVRKLLGLFLVSLLFVACSPPPPRITATTMGTAVNAGKISAPTTTFKPADHTLYLVVETENILGGTALGVKWYAVDAGSLKNQLLLENEVKLDPLNNSGEFALTSAGDLTPGKYKVVIFLNGIEDRTVEFQVQ
jgi:hypothetical protein